MNLNLNKLIEKIVNDSKLSEEFSKLDDMDEIYDYCKNMGVRCGKKEFDEEISKYIGVFNEDMYKKEIFEENLSDVGGGVNLKNKFSMSVASLLSALTMGNSIGLGSVGAMDDLKVSNNPKTNISFSEKISNEWSKTKEAFYKFYQKYKKIFIIVEVNVGMLVIAGAAILIRHKINDARTKEETYKIKNPVEKEIVKETSENNFIKELPEQKIPENNVIKKSAEQENEESEIDEEVTVEQKGADKAGDTQSEVVQEAEVVQPEIVEKTEDRQPKRGRKISTRQEGPRGRKVKSKVQQKNKKRRGRITIEEGVIQPEKVVEETAAIRSEVVEETKTQEQRKKRKSRMYDRQEEFRQEEVRQQQDATSREMRYHSIVEKLEKSREKSEEESRFKKLIRDWNKNPTKENLEVIRDFVENPENKAFWPEYDKLAGQNQYLQLVMNNPTAENWDALCGTKSYSREIRARAEAMRDIEKLKNSGSTGFISRFFGNKSVDDLSQNAEKSVSKAEKLGVKGIRELFDKVKNDLKLK